MTNKNSNQVVVPFDESKEQIKTTVSQHFNITFAHQKNVGILAKKIMAMVMSQISQKDVGFKAFYELRKEDLMSDDIKDEKSFNKEMKKALDSLTDLKWLIEDLDKDRFAYRHLLNTSDARCGYDGGVVTVVLNPLLKEYFIAMAHYTTYDLKWSMTFKSWYSMRLFEILSAYKDTGFWFVTVEEYRKLMDCETKYPDTRDLIKKTTTEPLKELERTKMAFTLEKVEDKTIKGRGRKPIFALRFVLKNAERKTIPETWWKDKNFSKTMDRLMKRYRVSEVNIARYAEHIGSVNMRLLLNDWDIKEASNNRIENKDAYCNKVFSDKGKQAIKDKEDLAKLLPLERLIEDAKNEK